MGKTSSKWAKRPGVKHQRGKTFINQSCRLTDGLHGSRFYTADSTA